MTFSLLVVDLLRYNDEFNHSFITFESYMQERERRVGPAPMPVSPVRTAASGAATILSTSPVKVNDQLEDDEMETRAHSIDGRAITAQTRQ